jgi:hypothetical protein
MTDARQAFLGAVDALAEARRWCLDKDGLYTELVMRERSAIGDRVTPLFETLIAFAREWIDEVAADLGGAHPHATRTKPPATGVVVRASGPRIGLTREGFVELFASDGEPIQNPRSPAQVTLAVAHPLSVLDHLIAHVEARRNRSTVVAEALVTLKGAHAKLLSPPVTA